jgi:hypothetical protein
MAETFQPLPISTFTNDTTAVNAVNNNFTAVSNTFNDVVSRSGVQPNWMTSTLDMNGNQIINLPFPQTLNSPARLADVTSAQTISIISATTGNSGHTVPFLDGSGSPNTWSTPNITTLAGLQTAITTNQNLGGTIATSLPCNLFQILENVNAGVNTISGISVQDTFGGTTAQGSRIGIVSNLIQQSATSPSNNNRNYLAIAGILAAQANDNGSSPSSFATSAGSYTGTLGEVTATSSATSLRYMNGLSGAVQMATGSSVWAKSILVLTGGSSDNVKGSSVDAMIWNWNQGNNAAFNTGILFDNGAGQGFWPISTTGTIFRTLGNGTAATGIDLSNTTFTNASFVANGFFVNQNGVIATGNAGVGNGGIQMLGSTSGFINFNTNNTATALSFAQGTFGTMFVLQGPSNTIANQLTISSAISGGTPTIAATGTDTNIGILFTAKGTGSIVIPQTLQLGLAGIGTGILNLLGSTSGNVILTTAATSGGILQFGSTGSFSANGGVATSLTSLGPTGSHTTVQTWLTILDSGGVTRYIPCF